MEQFATWLVDFVKDVVVWFYNCAVDLLNVCISGICSFAVSVVSLLPETQILPSAPDAPTSVLFDNVVTALNWLFPMGYFVSMVGFFVAAIILYATVAPVLRWFKLLR